MAEHTPGPWDWNQDLYEIQTKSGTVTIARLVMVGNMDDDEYYANARLMTAAPKMLEALLAAREFCRGRAEADGLALTLDRAIAEARGESHAY